MEDETNPTTTPETPAETTPPVVEEKPEEKPKEEELSPEVLRKELTAARAEAANYRTKLRDAEAKLSGAKTPEEFETAKAELSAKVAELEKAVVVATVARKFELPSELAEVLQGNTPEELEAHAKKLAKFAVAPDPKNLKGGLDPDDEEAEFDPVAEAHKARRRY